MRVRNGRLILSASDLANHLACGHRTDLDRASAYDLLPAPSWTDPALEALFTQEAGNCMEVYGYR